MLKRRTVVLGGPAAMLGSALHARAAASRRPLVYIGTQGASILLARLDLASGRLTLVGPAAAVARPTWVSVDPTRPILFATSEIGNEGEATGRIYSLAIDPASGKLRTINSVGSAGGGPTHLSYAPAVRTLFVANFGGGQVAAIPVRRDGTLLPATSVQTDTGSGPHPKQKSAHAHHVVLDPSGRFLLTADMGADRIFIRRYDARTGTLSPADPPFVQTPPGTGPRHLAFSRDGRFVHVLTEHTAEVRTFAWDRAAGRMTPVQAIPIDPAGFDQPRSAAEIVVSGDGRFVYASSRASNTIALFAADDATGMLTKLEDVPTRGLRPRSFGIDPSGRWMLVGNQDSSTIAVFAIDRASGRLTPVGDPTPTGEKPVSFAFFPA